MKFPNCSGTFRQSFCSVVRLMLLYLIIVPCVAAAEPGVPEQPAPSTLDVLVQEALARSPMLTAAQHIVLAPTNFEIAGQLALGMDSVSRSAQSTTADQLGRRAQPHG